MLAHRTSQVWLESELQTAGVLMHRWLYKNGVPTTAERMASRRIHKNIEEMENLRADLEVRLSQAVHATDEDTQAALRAQILD